MKDKIFDLYKFMFITTLITIVVALLFLVDYNFISVIWESFIQWCGKPFEWTQGYYTFVLLLLLINK